MPGDSGKRGLLAILLNAGGPQTGQTVLIDGKLPRQKFVDRQGVSATGFLKREETAAHCGNDFGFTPNDPPLGTGRGEVGNC
jgi:hypothetical protein